MTTLADLPHFTISSISPVGTSARLAGVFDHLGGVAEGRCWLFARNAESMIGDLIELNRDKKTAVFVAAYPNEQAAVGAKLPYVDGYWNASDIEMILDEAHLWKRVIFQAQNAAMSRYDGGRVLRKSSDMPARENAPQQIVAGGWDHEHCRFVGNTSILTKSATSMTTVTGSVTDATGDMPSRTTCRSWRFMGGDGRALPETLCAFVRLITSSI